MSKWNLSSVPTIVLRLEYIAEIEITVLETIFQGYLKTFHDKMNQHMLEINNP